MSTKVKNPEWLQDAVIYQLYPQSYNDTNGDGIGDLKGIIEKLDYIKSIGVNCVWISPIFESPFLDAGYDVSDFYKIAKRYGSLDDFKELIKEAKKREIKILLDLVAGHTSWEHPWFKESCKGENNTYSDYYIWCNSRRENGYIAGWGNRNGGYMNNFFFHQAALNYGFQNVDENCPWQISCDDPRALAVHQELRNVITYWMDLGVDGFRVDMAESLIKNDPDGVGIKKFWTDLRFWFNSDYPNGVLISEWGNPTNAIEAGFHVDFMHHFGSLGWWELFRDQVTPGEGWDVGFFSRSGKGCVEKFLTIFDEHYQRIKGKGYICLPSANHDIQRPSFNRSGRELRVIQALLLTMPTIPLIYYGDEIGMRYYPDTPNKEGGYHRSASRTPMQWDDSDNAGFSTAEKDKLYLPIDVKNDRPTVSKQDKDESSLLNLIRKLTQIRKEIPALENGGELIPLYAKDKKIPFVYLRENKNNYAMVVVNPSENDGEIDVKTDKISGNTILSEGVRVTEKEKGVWTIKVEAQSFGIYI